MRSTQRLQVWLPKVEALPGNAPQSPKFKLQNLKQLTPVPEPQPRAQPQTLDPKSGILTKPEALTVTP